MRRLTYLACPYSHPIHAVKITRFNQANRAAGKLMNEGDIVYSPISHTHPIASACELPGDWEYWKKLDEVYLSYCKRFVVLQLEGWDTSTGVLAEIEIAKRMGLNIEFMEGEDEHENYRG